MLTLLKERFLVVCHNFISFSFSPLVQNTEGEKKPTESSKEGFIFMYIHGKSRIPLSLHSQQFYSSGSLISSENSSLIYDFGDETILSYTSGLRNGLNLHDRSVVCVQCKRENVFSCKLSTLNSYIDLHQFCICNLREERFFYLH